MYNNYKGFLKLIRNDAKVEIETTAPSDDWQNTLFQRVIQTQK